MHNKEDIHIHTTISDAQITVHPLRHRAGATAVTRTIQLAPARSAYPPPLRGKSTKAIHKAHHAYVADNSGQIINKSKMPNWIQ